MIDGSLTFGIGDGKCNTMNVDIQLILESHSVSMSEENNNGSAPHSRRGRGNSNNNRRGASRFYRGGARFNRTQDSGPRERQFALLIPNNNGSSFGDDFFAGNSSVDPEPQLAVNIDLDGTCSYPGWKLYFPHEEYNPQSIYIKWTEAFKAHLSKYPLLYKMQHIRSNQWFALQLPRLYADQDFMQQWPQFKEDLLSRTDDVLLCAGLAAHQKIHNDLPPLTQTQGSRTVAQVALVIIRARILGHTPITEIRSLKRGTYGKLVSVRGTVIRVNAPRVICSWLVFRCVKCQGNQAIKSPSGYEIVQPRSCKSRGCTARGNFQPVVDSPFTRSESYQIIRLQESMQHSQTAAGEIPKSIEVELAYDLVDTVCPGDDVTLTGVIQAKSSEGKAQLESLHHFYLQAVSLCNNKNSLAARISDLSESDIEIIEQIRNGPSPLRTFVHSLCPNIFGHDMVKAGLMLALFGGSGTGTKKDVAPENAKRVESHVLVVGDPGVGKSHLLQACANVAPRGVFVCGNSTTNAGLTATVRHEKGVGGSLEAGALVLADQGVCCIDEFDKMSSNYQALLQAMEQQVVSVAKAGILCALPARTCILAAANPTGGHYDRSRTVAENLKMNPALLSRFDLVFILLDRADAYLDNLLTSHIQSLQTNRRPIASTSRLITATQAPPRAFSYTAKTGTPIAAIDNSLPLFERLRLESNEQINPVPHVIMQKYIGYARKNCFPTLSAEATAELKAFYMELRATRSGIDSIPVTTRQLEALIRLTQARARLDLCNLATVEHAQDVLAILRFSMVDVMSTEQNTLSMRRNINGAGMSQATQAKKFLQALQISGKALLSSDDMKIIASTIGVQANLTNLIDALNVQGFLIKRGHNLYKFNT